MSNKFEKKDKCLYCEKPMEAVYRNKKFCSTKCRVYWGRENAKSKTTVSVINDAVKIIGKEAIPVAAVSSKKEQHELFKEGDPRQNTMAFYLKYDCYTYEELKNKKS